MGLRILCIRKDDGDGGGLVLLLALEMFELDCFPELFRAAGVVLLRFFRNRSRFATVFELPRLKHFETRRE